MVSGIWSPSGVYSIRLAMNLGSGDYFGSLQRTKKPMALIAGGNDDQCGSIRPEIDFEGAKPA
jgi:hypothetical protein